MVEGTQDESHVTEFGNTRSQSCELTDVCTSTIKYDLVGDIAKGANLTRSTVVKILQGIKQIKLYLFKNNPEEFIRKVISIIREQKSTMIVEAIHYNITEGKYDSDIFTVKSKMDFERAYEAKKHITIMCSAIVRENVNLPMTLTKQAKLWYMPNFHVPSKFRHP